MRLWPLMWFVMRVSLVSSNSTKPAASICRVRRRYSTGAVWMPASATR